MPDTRTETPADEMREAASRVRLRGSAASRPPWRRDGMAIATGSGVAALAYNGVDADWIELMATDLAGPLASWLKQTASDYEAEVNPRVSGRDRTQPFCDRCGLWLVQVCTDQELCSCWDGALAVARVLNGGAR